MLCSTCFYDLLIFSGFVYGRLGIALGLRLLSKNSRLRAARGVSIIKRTYLIRHFISMCKASHEEHAVCEFESILLWSYL